MNFLGTVNVLDFSSRIELKVVGENLVFSNDKGDFGDLPIPNGWSPMLEIGVPPFFFQIVNHTLLFFLTVVDGKALFGEVSMFVLFDKGAMQGKVLIRYNDGKLEFSLEDWSEISFIPLGISQGAEPPMIVHEREVWSIEGIDERNGGVIATFVELGDKLFFCLTKLVFDEGTPTHEHWMITLPRIADWTEVSFSSFERVNFTNGNMMGEVVFEVKIHDELFTIQVIYQSQGDYIITEPTSLLLFATSTITASLESSSGKVVGEIWLPYDELKDGSSTLKRVFGL